MPWPKGRKPSEEHRRKISEGNKGKCRTEEFKKRQSESRKGKNHPMWGKKHTEEAKRRMSVVRKGRPSPLKGRKLSEEHKKKLSEARKGKHHSEETKRKMSDAHKGEKNHNWGKHPSKETRRKLSESRRGEKNSMWGKNHSDEAKRKISRARLDRVFPIRDTSIEVAMQGELGVRGIVFEKHVPLLGRYQVDIKIGDLVVECDGNYWHNFPDGTEKDHRRDVDFKEAGYSVLRFWGSEINADVSRCVDVVEGVLNKSGSM